MYNNRIMITAQYVNLAVILVDPYGIVEQKAHSIIASVLGSSLVLAINKSIW